MGILRVDHPDVEEFIRVKQNDTSLTGFNISLAITDEFMRAVESGSQFDLRFNKEVYRSICARTLWETIMRSTWDWAEPGVLFIDRINEMNNLQYCEKIAATNPCAEQPLPPFGACLLGSFNLVKYLKLGDRGYEFLFDKFSEDIPHVVRAMDNVVDRALYPLYEQEKEAKSKRRMGLGVTGLANALEAIGHPYGGPGFVEFMRRILKFMANRCYMASVDLAKEKGAFPLCDERYGDSKFLKMLDQEVQEAVEEHGIRNSHLLSIAPTGTISLCADNISSGIEPVFEYEFERTVIEFGNQPTKYEVSDYGFRELGVQGRRAQDVTVDEHLAVLEEAYRWVDSAVSKTCNVPSDTPWEDFKALYFRAWKAGCKGCTTYQVGGRRAGVLEAKPTKLNTDEPEKACAVNAETGHRDCE
jgi:ribonucleoside-diphosphate reductase alpha chain